MNQRRCISRAHSGNVILAVVLWGVAGSLAVAQNHYVMPDGKKYKLSRSATDLVVELQDAGQAAPLATHLAKEGRGRLENLKSVPGSRFKMVSGTNAAKRRELETAAGVIQARHVYQYDELGSIAISTGTIAVRVKNDSGDADRAAMWAEFGVTELRPAFGMKGVYIVAPLDSEADEVALAEKMAGDDRLKWANPNFMREQKTFQATPSDEYFDLQWHLHNTGQTGGTAGADIDAIDAWDLGTGEGILIGMFDDSCDVDHDDLRDNYIGIGQDVSLPFFDADYENPRPKVASDAHGTAVMGLAAASGNSLGVRGVAFNSTFTATRGVGLATDEAIATAYSYAMDLNVDVHINSWGFRGAVPTPPIIGDAIVEAATLGRDPDGDGPLPPRGMVILFASGNEDSEFKEGFSLAGIPEVIAVGASTEQDFRAGFSNYGVPLDILAPGSGEVFVGVTTTDTEDGPIAQGYNEGGRPVNPDTGQGYPNLEQDIDPEGKYTGFFGGTSAACPIAAGVAALILSINPELDATDVRLILEHTAEQVQPSDASYDPITRHSLNYGYGRVNAANAAEAAKESLTNGNLTWPASAANVIASGSTLTWTAERDTDEFLVLESEDILSLTPEDGKCYDDQQANCPAGGLAELPAGVNVLYVGCASGCTVGAEQSTTFVRPNVGIKIFFVYARNTETGKYSFGARATSEQAEPPAVTIQASTLEGNSPLTVNFKGNATSTVAIDESRTAWDFDVASPPNIDSTSRDTTHTYEAGDSETRTYVARLTMYDINGVAGSEQVAITVHGAEGDSGDPTAGQLQIIVGLPGTPDSNVSSGTSPFDVVLSVDATSLAGDLQAISWDLGDGSTSSSLIVPHTYINEGTFSLRIPITATVTMTTSSTTTMNISTTRIITVAPGSGGNDNGDVGECELPGTCADGPGGSASTCGTIGMLPLMFLVLALSWMRRNGG